MCFLLGHAVTCISLRFIPPGAVFLEKALVAGFVCVCVRACVRVLARARARVCVCKMYVYSYVLSYLNLYMAY